MADWDPPSWAHVLSWPGYYYWTHSKKRNLLILVILSGVSDYDVCVCDYGALELGVLN